LVAILHSLKSSAKAVGAEPLAKRTESLEFAARAADFSLIKSLKKDFLKLLQQTIHAIEVYLAE
jgi:HPt (histidine-containing phosphotransfer) domain-containing protein